MARVQLVKSDREFADGTVCVEPGARQSEAAETDINRIVSQFVKTGFLPQGFAEGVFADVSEIGDYRSAVERVRAAEVEFMKLPPQVRGRFDNDPLAFVEFAVDPKNKRELQDMGLLEIDPERRAQDDKVAADAAAEKAGKPA